jgi:hypothetical protein
MKLLEPRILRISLIAAIISAGIGWGLASVAGIIMQSELGSVIRDEEELQRLQDSVVEMKYRIPMVCAVGTMAIIVLVEGGLALLRKPKSTIQATKPALSSSGMDPEVEALLNQILAQSGDLVSTPPPAALREPAPEMSSTAH